MELSLTTHVFFKISRPKGEVKQVNTEMEVPILIKMREAKAPPEELSEEGRAVMI
jgi:hypothetical protein